jgi:hypothetical protein
MNGSKRARMSKSEMKTTLITLFDIKCTVHLGFIQRSPTANQAETLKRLREAVRRKTA